MLRKFALILLIITSITFWNCAGGNGAGQGDVDKRFASGLDRFDKKKWSRAAEDFNWVVLNNPAGNLAAEAQYYYAESIFQQDLFVEAQLEFERLLRRWPGSEHRDFARYRIVQSLVAQSPNFYFDQEATLDAIEELQDFIDDFPDSDHLEEAEQSIGGLRHKIAKKYYETARLYLKWGQSPAARLYLEMILSRYYDTPFADKARVAMVISYIIAEDLTAAQAYLEQEGSNISDDTLRGEAERFVDLARAGKVDLLFYRRLYR